MKKKKLIVKPTRLIKRNGASGSASDELVTGIRFRPEDNRSRACIRDSEPATLRAFCVALATTGSVNRGEIA